MDHAIFQHADVRSSLNLGQGDLDVHLMEM